MINTDYAQLREWANTPKKIEFMPNCEQSDEIGWVIPDHVKPLDKVVDEVFKPVIIEVKHDSK